RAFCCPGAATPLSLSSSRQCSKPFIYSALFVSTQTLEKL
ncbi:MAG: hypothetical protein AVDCRST_MAG86-618, partial [uncultured Truepera sp.]